MPKREVLEQLCVQVPPWLELMGCTLALSESKSADDRPVSIRKHGAELKEELRDYQLRLATLLAQLDSQPEGGRFRAPNDWFLLSIPLNLRMYINDCCDWKLVRYHGLPFVQYLGLSRVTPRAALQLIADFPATQDRVESFLFVMLTTLMYEWSMRWVARLARERSIPRYPMFLPVDRFPENQAPLDVHTLSRRLGISGGTIHNKMSKARQNNEDFGGLCEGQLVYPGSKMNGVICKRKPKGGYLFYLDTVSSVADPNNLLT